MTDEDFQVVDQHHPCPKCASDVTRLDRFCPECGHPLDARARDGSTTKIVLIVVGAVLLVSVGFLVFVFVFLGPRLVIEGSTAAREKRARTEMEAIGQAIDLYRVKHQRPPESLEALTVSDVGAAYIQRVPSDPWDNAYEYEVLSKNTYRITSFGADGMRETDDDLHWMKID